MDKTQALRLLNVARALRESKTPERFDMSRYIHGDLNSVYNNTPEWCGTPACALGHYAAREDLQDLLKVYVFSSGKKASMVYVSGEKKNYPADFGSIEVGTHFGLGYDDLEEIFGSSGCGQAKTADQAADFIETYVCFKAVWDGFSL